MNHHFFFLPLPKRKVWETEGCRQKEKGAGVCANLAVLLHGVTKVHLLRRRHDLASASSLRGRLFSSSRSSSPVTPSIFPISGAIFPILRVGGHPHEGEEDRKRSSAVRRASGGGGELVMRSSMGAMRLNSGRQAGGLLASRVRDPGHLLHRGARRHTTPGTPRTTPRRHRQVRKQQKQKYSLANAHADP